MGENDVRTLLLEAIEGSLRQPIQPQQPAELHQELRQNVIARATWWSHVRDRFFLGDESWMLRELRVERNAFEDLVNAVADLPLQRSGRRAFVFARGERLLFLRTSLTFRPNVAQMLLLRIKSPSEVNKTEKSIDCCHREPCGFRPLPRASQRSP